MKDTLLKKTLPLIKNKRVILNWATGSGKSKMSIDMINSITDNTTLNILLVVQETNHKKNWMDEIEKFPLKNSNIHMECYQSLHKHANKYYDVIIFDEGHHLNTEKRLSILNTLKAEYIIVLSATIDKELLYNLEFRYGKFVVSKFILSEAINSNVLPTPKIHIIELELNNSIKNEEIIESRGNSKKEVKIHCDFKDRWIYLNNKSKYPNLKLIMKATQWEKYFYLSNKLEYYKRLYFRTSTEAIKNKWLRYGSERKLFLGESKTDIIKKIINQNKDKRFICFCSSIKQANKLGSKYAIHSKIKNPQDLIEDFNNKKINRLFAVGMLQEGQNLTDIEVGIIGQLDGKERGFIQKFGRTLRALKPIQYIIYYKNTQDENYFNKIKDLIEDYL